MFKFFLQYKNKDKNISNDNNNAIADNKNIINLQVFMCCYELLILKIIDDIRSKNDSAYHLPKNFAQLCSWYTLFKNDNKYDNQSNEVNWQTLNYYLSELLQLESNPKTIAIMEEEYVEHYILPLKIMLFSILYRFKKNNFTLIFNKKDQARLWDVLTNDPFNFTSKDHKKYVAYLDDLLHAEYPFLGSFSKIIAKKTLSYLPIFSRYLDIQSLPSNLLNNKPCG